jgi:hypothetical protein
MIKKTMRFSLIPILVLGLLVTLFPQQGQALSGSDFNAGYIIDDSVFFNGSAMDSGQIQQFLNSKVPVCDTNHSGVGSNQPPFTCLKDYRQDTTNKSAEAGLCNGHVAGNKSAAQIIYEVGQSCGVSQKALLVLLQKEQSLVTDTWPWNIQYRSATGYGCPDTAPCDAEYYGFFNQVYAAARQFKRYVKDSHLFNFRAGTTSNIQYNPNASCGSSPVYIQNPATAALYNYTPYQPNASALANLYGSGDSCGAYGNRNFWRLFNDWFGTTKPAGKWLRQDSAGQVWLITEGLMPDGSYARKRFKLTSWDMYVAYFLQFEPVVPVTDEYLSQFNDDGVLGTMAIGRSYSQIQFMDSGHRFHIATGQQCTDWGLDCFNTNIVKTIPGTEFLERLPGTGTLREAASTNGRVYRMSQGNKLPVLDWQTYVDLGLNNPAKISNMQSINLQQPLGPLQISHDTVIQFTPTSPVLFYSSSSFSFHKIANYDIFSAWNFEKYAHLNPIPSSFTTSPPVLSSTDLSVWASDASGRKYLVDQKRKIDVTSVANLPTTNFPNIAPSFLQQLPYAVYGNNSYDTNTGSVFVLGNGQKRHVPSWQDFMGLDLSLPHLLPLSSFSLSQFSNGAYLLADGSVFDDGGLFIVNSTSKYNIVNPNYFEIFNLDWYRVVVGQTNLDTAYSGTSNLSVLIKSGTNQYSVAVNRNRYLIDPTIMAHWGLSSSSFIDFSDKNLQRLPVAGSIGRFIQAKDGKVYYANGGERHHIQSYSSFTNLGGHPSSLINVPDEFTDLLPLGSPIP